MEPLISPISTTHDRYPESTIVYIEVTFSGGETVNGSGVMIGLNDVLTAAHLLWDADLGAASEITVYPGIDGFTDMPFGSHSGAYVNYYQVDIDGDGQFTLEDYQNDLAVIGLETRVGGQTGWMGLDPTGNIFYPAKVTGYPTDYADNDGPRMFEDSGVFSSSSIGGWSVYDFENPHDEPVTTLEIYPGNEGSPYWHVTPFLLPGYRPIDPLHPDWDQYPYVTGVVSNSDFGSNIAGNYESLIDWIFFNDFLLESGSDIFPGTDNPEQLSGTPDADEIYALAGNDTVNGLGSNDIIYGNDDQDVLNGQAGSDLLYGGPGNDVINAGPGNDVVYGNRGNDHLLGMDGNDTLFGGTGPDTIIGDGTNPGRDLIYGNAGNDDIDDLRGAGTIYGGLGDDTVITGASSDLIYGNRGSDELRGDAGNDTLWGGTAADRVYGGAGNDMVVGNASTDVVHGGGGDDTLYGGIDNDSLWGGTGDDWLYGAAGDDRFIAGIGADVIVIQSNGGNDTVAGGLGGDVVHLEANINGTDISMGADVVARLSVNGNGDAVADLGDGHTLTFIGLGLDDLATEDFLVF